MLRIWRTFFVNRVHKHICNKYDYFAFNVTQGTRLMGSLKLFRLLCQPLSLRSPESVKSTVQLGNVNLIFDFDYFLWKVYGSFDDIERNSHGCVSISSVFQFEYAPTKNISRFNFRLIKRSVSRTTRFLNYPWTHVITK